MYNWHGGYSGQGVVLTTHPHVVPRLKKEQSYIYTPLWTFMACCRVNLIHKRVSTKTERATDFLEESD